jgi:hypothetical protein
MVPSSPGGGGGSGVSDHGGLTGLTDDDHSQYVHVSVARTVSAVHTFNPGSAGPFAVLGANAADQNVPGLDADTLDGSEATDFAAAVHTHAGEDVTSGTVAAARLGVMTGDAGAGGAKGAVPAPAAGDAAAGKYLDADGTWTVPPGTGGGGASTELDNLGTTAVNADIDPGTDAAVALGSSSLRWSEANFSTGMFLWAALGDTKPSGAYLGDRVEFGAGGSADPDVVLSRAAADVLALGVGDSFRLQGGTSGHLTFVVPAVVTSYAVTWPAADAAGVLTSDGAGALSWAAGGGGSAAWASASGVFEPVPGTSGSTIQAGDQMEYRARVADGEIAVAHVFTSENDLSTPGARIAEWYRDDRTTLLASLGQDGLFGPGSALAQDIGSAALPWRDTYGRTVNVQPTVGAELAPALTTGNWTLGTGWSFGTTPDRLVKGANGTGTAQPTPSLAPTAGEVYKIVFTVSAMTVANVSVAFGGNTYRTVTVDGTYTDFVTAFTSGNLTFSPSNTSRFDVTVVSVTLVDPGTGSLASTAGSTLSPYRIARLEFDGGLQRVGFGPQELGWVGVYDENLTTNFAVAVLGRAVLEGKARSYLMLSMYQEVQSARSEMVLFPHRRSATEGVRQSSLVIGRTSTNPPTRPWLTPVTIPRGLEVSALDTHCYGDFWVPAGSQLGFGGSDTTEPGAYWTKSAITGGNSSLFYGATETLRDDGTNWRVLGSLGWGLYDAIGDTNPVVALTAAGIVWGAGGASAPDLKLERVSGNLIVTGLPTSDPAVAGALWNNSGVLTVSAG